MTAPDLRDGTLAAVPPELVREVSRAFAASTDSGEGTDARDIRPRDAAESTSPECHVLESQPLSPDALLDAGVHALARVVAHDCATRAAALPLLAADALVTRAMEVAASRYQNPAELRDFAERAMLRLGACAPTPDAAGGLAR